MKLHAAALGTLVVLGACGAEPGSGVPDASVDPPPGTTSIVAPAVVLEDCADVPRLSGEVLTDLPGAENPEPGFIELIEEYSKDHLDTFAGLWIDRDAGGTVVVAFTDDPEPHRAELAGRGLPSFDVVQAAYSIESLVGFVDSAQAAMATVPGVTADAYFGRPDLNRAQLEPGTIDAVLLAELATVVGAAVPLAAVCVEGPVRGAPPTFAPDVIVVPDADGGIPDDLVVTCESWYHPLPLSEWLAARPLSEFAALAPLIAEGTTDRHDFFGPPGQDWRVLAADDNSATMFGLGDEGVRFVDAERGRSGWSVIASGGASPCELEVALPVGLAKIAWAPDPSFPAPSADDTELHLVVFEAVCADMPVAAGALVEPQVVETESAVVVMAAGSPVSARQSCPGGSPTPVTITLTRPLGDREIRDNLTIGNLRDLLADEG